MLQALGGMQAVNASVYELPASAERLFRRRADIEQGASRVSAFQQAIAGGVQSLLALNDTLAALPDLADVRASLADGGLSFIIANCLICPTRLHSEHEPERASRASRGQHAAAGA